MEESSGALVGWRSQNMGSRIALTLQRVNKPPPHEADDVHNHLFVLDKNQAIQLAYHLFQMAGATAPNLPKRSLLSRLLRR